jgi:hypothetical protein
MRALPLLALGAIALVPGQAMANSVITIVNGDAPGEGFNDPTPVAPVGGNPGVTLGEQRLNAFQEAANIWGELLDSSVEIHVLAFFNPLTCTATSAVLGSAGALTVDIDFPGALIPNTWYSQALANRLAGVDRGVDEVTGENIPDIQAQFNSNLNGNPACLGGQGWYLGFDNNFGTNIDLITVLLHEFGHGLGFQTFANRATGALFLGSPDAYLLNLFDNTTDKFWDEMTDAERAASAINPRQVVWTGENVTAAVPDFLAPGTPVGSIDSPASIAGERLIGGATFGPPIGDPITGEVVAGNDGGGAGTATDGCEPLTNGADVAGNIALLDRGLCGFTIKVANAQAAGAIAVLIADNVAGSPPAALGGADPTITIPSARITLADGNAIRAALATEPVVVTLELDLSRRSGADAEDRVMMFTPDPLVGGSSVSHWDTSATPNVLMEPSLNVDLGHDVDLTLPLFRDIGWLADEDLDGILDDADNCPTIANAGQEDRNDDGIGDACPIRPLVTCIVRRGLNFTARFGYDNAESVTRSLPVGLPFNFFIPGINRGQPGSFDAGRHDAAFEVNGTLALIWVLGERTAIATVFSPRCQ